MNLDEVYIPKRECDKNRHEFLEWFGCWSPEGTYCGGCYRTLREFEGVLERMTIQAFREVMESTGFVNDQNWPAIWNAVMTRIEQKKESP